MTDATNALAISDIEKLPSLEWFRERGFSKWDTSDMNRFVSMYEARDRFIAEYGFSIPCREAVEAIKGYGPIVEIGAGTGYWAKIMQLAGIDVIATDSWDNGYKFQIGKHFPVERQNGAAAVIKYAPRTVFCSWPSYDDTWAASALKVMKGGRCFIYIGEGHGGCTGNDEFHELLDADFTLLDTVAIPQFPGIGDYMEIWRRVK